MLEMKDKNGTTLQNGDKVSWIGNDDCYTICNIVIGADGDEIVIKHMWRWFNVQHSYFNVESCELEKVE